MEPLIENKSLDQLLIYKRILDAKISELQKETQVKQLTAELNKNGYYLTPLEIQHSDASIQKITLPYYVILMTYNKIDNDDAFIDRADIRQDYWVDIFEFKYTPNDDDYWEDNINEPWLSDDEKSPAVKRGYIHINLYFKKTSRKIDGTASYIIAENGKIYKITAEDTKLYTDRVFFVIPEKLTKNLLM